MKMSFVMCCALTVAAIFGCQARVEITKEKALAKIDTLLGTMDVKRTEINLSLNALKGSVDGLRKAKIRAQVKSDQLDRIVAPIKEKIAAIDQSLGKLREHLASGKAVEIAGRTYSPQALRQMTDCVLRARKDYVARREGLQQSEESLEKVVTTLRQKQQEYERHLLRLQAQITEIDAKRIALNAMKDASAAMGESEGPFTSSLGDLEGKVHDLLAEVKAELRFETEMWDVAAAERELDSVDAFIYATQEPHDLLAEIDSILGPTE